MALLTLLFSFLFLYISYCFSCIFDIYVIILLVTSLSVLYIILFLHTHALPSVPMRSGSTILPITLSVTFYQLFIAVLLILLIKSHMVFCYNVNFVTFDINLNLLRVSPHPVAEISCLFFLIPILLTSNPTELLDSLLCQTNYHIKIIQWLLNTVKNTILHCPSVIHQILKKCFTIPWMAPMQSNDPPNSNFYT